MYQQLTIHLENRSYPIFIGTDILKDLGNFINSLIPTASRSLIITNSTVEKLYGQVVLDGLKIKGLNPSVSAVPDGEAYKTLEMANTLFDQLLEHQMDRSSVVISLGGGVIGDLAGFVASTYMRGIPFVQVPTSLLAQVDSSVGGKVAVNHRMGKNLIGAFHQPRLVLIDTATLQTLPREELVAGMAEVVKHGMILDARYFSWIERSIDLILKGDHDTLTKMVYGSCLIKGKVVEADEREEHLRRILNFGHTVGHALEALTHYERYRHGEAVAIGMVQACRFAQNNGLIDEQVVRRLVQLLKELSLPTKIPNDILPVDILQAIKRDKKAYQDKIRLILPVAIGQVKTVDQWEETELLKVLESSYESDQEPFQKL